MRLIDADDLKLQLRDMHMSGVCVVDREILFEIDDSPTVDVRPVVRGWWLNGHCTSCGEDVASFLDTWTDIQRFLYCPYCGSMNEVG